MNYLAHLALSQSSVESRVGNLLGDFCKGVDTKALPVGIQAGLANHRLVDRLTDQHPQVKYLKTLISPQRRRFAGVILDLCFDHFLIAHWHEFYEGDYHLSKGEFFEQLTLGLPLMPERMQYVVSRVVAQDWFETYERVEGVGFALDRIAQRIRFTNQFEGSIEEIDTHYTQIEQSFLTLYPEIQAQVADARLELL
ncbi:ACP phosphodiesterase [Paraferrimonas sedimenticola]|uniref:ACP phosphodiesterase n=1 Tax=Paraferrimonas sedimenticola TaxID=375674 RepID=A0AA37RWZ3_9GAMM|nr:ACP phosphodiesterase [Paraferrimonas sedimenticola]GLP96936.1 ACP phosphodiesterase [Paraferrimonas sedimenticola]